MNLFKEKHAADERYEMMFRLFVNKHAGRSIAGSHMYVHL